MLSNEFLWLRGNKRFRSLMLFANAPVIDACMVNMKVGYNLIAAKYVINRAEMYAAVALYREFSGDVQELNKYMESLPGRISSLHKALSHMRGYVGTSPVMPGKSYDDCKNDFETAHTAISRLIASDTDRNGVTSYNIRILKHILNGHVLADDVSADVEMAEFFIRGICVCCGKYPEHGKYNRLYEREFLDAAITIPICEPCEESGNVIVWRHVARVYYYVAAMFKNEYKMLHMRFSPDVYYPLPKDEIIV